MDNEQMNTINYKNKVIYNYFVPDCSGAQSNTQLFTAQYQEGTKWSLPPESGTRWALEPVL